VILPLTTTSDRAPVELVRYPKSDILDEARPVLVIMAESLQALQSQMALLDCEIATRARADPIAKRLMAIPGVGPVVATALVAVDRRGRGPT
jgi:transposase